MIVLGSWLSGKKKKKNKTAHTTTLQAQLQDLLQPYVPQILQQGSCYVHEVKTTVHIIQTKPQVGSETSSH